MPQAYSRAQKLIRALERPELEKLQALIAARLKVLDEQEKKQARATKASQGRSDQQPRGHVEEKWITSRGKQYGPYRYRRWWGDGTLRSEYLGKAEGESKKSKRK